VPEVLAADPVEHRNGCPPRSGNNRQREQEVHDLHVSS
jgi:hypothetical protein